jgi:splicing factor 3B subunit 4
MNHHGRVRTLNMPVDRVNGKHQGFGFVEFASEQDANYAINILHGTRLYGSQIRMNKASADKQKTIEIGAELFIGNLDQMVDERSLYDTFIRFGQLTSAPKVARDENMLSKGYGFVSYADFEASDNAIQHMHGQYMMNKQISVQYAYKKDGKGERHGDEAERLLAKQAKAHGVAPVVDQLPEILFQTAQPQQQTVPVGRGVPGAPNGPSGYGGAMPPVRAPAQSPLQPPPSGLPARPPSVPNVHHAGYGPPGGPPGYYAPPPGLNGMPPPGFNGPPPGFNGPPPPGFNGGPPGFNAPPPGYNGGPPGFGR